MFDTVLIANRGEIAVRIIRTLRRLGVRSVAVYSDADAGALHVREADVAVRLGAAPAKESYLHVERIIEAARSTGAQAVHPGYGFLAENPRFATACAVAGIVWVGPSPHAMEVMGDKIRAKAAVGAAGVPVVPGSPGSAVSDDDLVTAAADVGYPVLVKPSAGGGGKGMHLVERAADLPEALRRARREAASAFDDDTLFLERFVERPRHIEVQVLADTAGTIVHLGERECSLQRRHQKVIEEAPSALLDAATRERIGASACSTARSVGYTGVGTVEFIVGADRPDEYFFMEMNTRLQVEHPVTEMVTGLDLVEQQLLVAAGGALGFDQGAVQLNGHAIEARVYAEDPAKGFLPTGGRAIVVDEPAGEGIRFDSGLVAGVDIATTYDPMLAKVVAWAPDRASALARIDRALAGTVLLGFGTNVAFLRALIGHPDVVAGRLDTGLIERDLDRLVGARPAPVVAAAYALWRLLEAWPQGPIIDPWDLPNGWRVGDTSPLRFALAGADGETAKVAVRGTPASAWVTVGDDAEVPATIVATGSAAHGPSALVTFAGLSHPVVAATAGPTTWIHIDGAAWPITEAQPTRRTEGDGAGDADIRSPMPGTVLAVNVSDGDAVTTGQAVIVVEAMKMEHSLSAPHDGTVEVMVKTGDQVELNQVVARVTET